MNTKQKDQSVNADVLSIATKDGVPRIRDLDLAAFLGFKRRADIRELIRRHESDLGEVYRSVRKTSAKGGRPASEAWLTEEQSLYIVAKAATSQATVMLKHIISVFLRVRRGIGAMKCSSVITVDALIATDPLPQRAAAIELARDVYGDAVLRSVMRLEGPYVDVSGWLNTLREHARAYRILHGKPAGLELVVGGAS